MGPIIKKIFKKNEYQFRVAWSLDKALTILHKFLSAKNVKAHNVTQLQKRVIAVKLPLV